MKIYKFKGESKTIELKIGDDDISIYAGCKDDNMMYVGGINISSDILNKLRVRIDTSDTGSLVSLVRTTDGYPVFRTFFSGPTTVYPEIPLEEKWEENEEEEGKGGKNGTTN